MNSWLMPARGTAESSETLDVTTQTMISSHPPADDVLSTMRLPDLEIGTTDSLPRSPTPTMKTESVDTDSASSLISSSHEVSTSSPPQDTKTTLFETLVALKLLVSNGASGLIIGRSGSTISDLQAKSQSRIKLSQDGSFFPGTSDRICLIQGTLSNASLGVEMVLSKLYDLQSIQQITSTMTRTNLNESLQVEGSMHSFIVRLLIPSTFCGKIIGRSGSNIKVLKDQSNVTYIQLSPKEHEFTSERIMTIIGPNLSSCVKCIHIILDNMAQNSEISRYINMTTMYPKMMALPTTSTYAAASTTGFYMEHESFHSGIMTGASSTFMSSSHPHHDQGMFPSPPRHPHAIPPSSPSYPQYQTSPSQSGQFCPPFFATSSPDRDERSSGGENFFTSDQFDQNFQPHAATTTPITVKIGVPASKIGSMIGRGGKNLSELQAHSRTKIRISQQGDFIPGTQNRIVTITGNDVQSVEYAKLLVRQCLSMAGSRSSQSNDIG